MARLPSIGITMGDAAGVGPEVVIKALAHREVYTQSRPLVIGDARQLERAKKALKLNLDIRSIRKPADAEFEFGTVDCIDLALLQSDVPFVKISTSPP